jgi:DNA-binding transcriptional LysR family regulator
MGSSISFDLWPLQKETVNAIEHGRIDLLLHCEGTYVPQQLPRELLFKEELICVVAKESHYPDRFLLRDYLEAFHISVSTFDGMQTNIEDRLAANGLKRKCALRVPYFSMAVHGVAGTNLVATVPKRITDYEARGLDVRMVAAPRMLSNFEYHMSWHPRMNLDAAHMWLRSHPSGVREHCRTRQ